VRDEGIRWGRLSRGLYLVGIGTFLLLTTQDVLPWSFWSDAASFWPVLLVAIGVRLLFERSSMPWAVLLGPFLVLGTLMYVARRGPAAPDAGRTWLPLRVERPADLTAWTLEGRLALVRCDLTSQHLERGVLLEGRGTDAGRRSVRLTSEGSHGRVRLTNSWFERTWLALPGESRPRCDLGVSTALPVALDFELAFTDTRLDVAASPVSRVAFSGAFNDLSLRLGEPATDVSLDLDGSFNRVVLEVPASTPVRVSTEGFLNSVDESRGDGAPHGGPGYRLRLEGAFNRLLVRSW
jgi:hypothetical protein